MQYFGTDGIRGQYGHSLITAEGFFKLGWATAKVLNSKLIIISRDTRSSGRPLLLALIAGIETAGCQALSLGVLPTPVLAWLVPELEAQAGLVISASHNPHQDNGCKFFNQFGLKLTHEQELAIEANLALGPALQVEPAASEFWAFEAMEQATAAHRYQEHCIARFDQLFKPMRLVLDCAEGACYALAPQLLKNLRLQPTVLDSGPQGDNINHQCGALYPQVLSEAVVAAGADLGVAFDGDGDRLIMADHLGEILDGDELLYILAMWYQQQGLLQGGVVGTVMSNLGLERGLKAQGIPFHRTPVGDRHILHALLERGWNLGGENSGHILNLDLNHSGDGLLSALQIIHIVQTTGQSLHNLKQGMQKMPQVILNVPSKTDTNLLSHPNVARKLESVTDTLAERGRVLLRASGTEPLIRIMLEGTEAQEIKTYALEIAELLRDLQTTE